MKDKDKIRLVVRAFLCANKGKWYSARELCEFVNVNGFGGRSGATVRSVSRMLDANWLFKVGIKRERKNNKQVWKYGVFN